MNRRELLTGLVAATAIPLSSTLATAQERRALPPSGIYFDDMGLIVQRDGDGGDTAQREGWYWFGTWVRKGRLGKPWPHARELSFEQVMTLLEFERTGSFRRHPKGSWSDLSDFTRDQTIPLVAAMGVRDDRERLQRFYHELRRRNWWAQKFGDTMADPINRNFIARCRNERPNPMTDSVSLAFAVGARVATARAKGPDDVGDDLNLVIQLTLATIRGRTNGVDWARASYAKNRPDNYGMYLESYRREWGPDTTADGTKAMVDRMDAGIRAGWRPDCPRVLGALRWYFRVESLGCPGLADLYEPIVLEWFQ